MKINEPSEWKSSCVDCDWDILPPGCSCDDDNCCVICTQCGAIDCFCIDA